MDGWVWNGALGNADSTDSDVLLKKCQGMSNQGPSCFAMSTLFNGCAHLVPKPTDS